jgi:hypothetical protein
MPRFRVRRESGWKLPAMLVMVFLQHSQFGSIVS